MHACMHANVCIVYACIAVNSHVVRYAFAVRILSYRILQSFVIRSQPLVEIVARVCDCGGVAIWVDLVRYPCLWVVLRQGHGGLYKASKKEESERLRAEGYQIKFIDLSFERCSTVVDLF